MNEINFYRVKTRNWYGRRWVKSLIDMAHHAGAQIYADDGDADAKYWLETKSAPLAWSVWLYWTLLSPLSGGWTYIVRPGHQLSGGTYARIY